MSLSFHVLNSMEFDLQEAKVGCLLHVSLASWESRMRNLDEHLPHSLWQRAIRAKLRPKTLLLKAAASVWVLYYIRLAAIWNRRATEVRPSRYSN